MLPKILQAAGLIVIALSCLALQDIWFTKVKTEIMTFSGRMFSWMKMFLFLLLQSLHCVLKKVLQLVPPILKFKLSRNHSLNGFEYLDQKKNGFEQNSSLWCCWTILTQQFLAQEHFLRVIHLLHISEFGNRRSCSASQNW